MLGGTTYVAEGRFPYNGYVGAQNKFLRYANYLNQPQSSSYGGSSYGGSGGGYGGGGSYGGGGYGGGGSYGGGGYGGGGSYGGGNGGYGGGSYGGGGYGRKRRSANDQNDAARAHRILPTF